MRDTPAAPRRVDHIGAYSADHIYSLVRDLVFGISITSPPARRISGRNQPGDATDLWNLAAGVSTLRVFHGRSLSHPARPSNSTREWTERLDPVKEYCLNAPLMFSFESHWCVSRSGGERAGSWRVSSCASRHGGRQWKVWRIAAGRGQRRLRNGARVKTTRPNGHATAPGSRTTRMFA